MEDYIQNFMKDVGCFFINPVFDGLDKKNIIGFYYDCWSTHKLKEVRESLLELFSIGELEYSLSVLDNDSQSTKIIIYLNSK